MATLEIAERAAHNPWRLVGGGGARKSISDGLGFSHHKEGEQDLGARMVLLGHSEFEGS